MTSAQDSSAVSRLQAIQKHLSSSPDPSSTRKAADLPPGNKYFPNQQPFDPFRPVKTIIVGTGICGVAAAVLLSKKVKNHTVKVYEKNSRGGTWAINQYPGVRCDVPSHAYQLTFAPNTKWTEYYPKQSEIQQYYENILVDYGIKDKISFNHEVVKAIWREQSSKWEVEVKNLETGEIVVDEADFLVTAPGRLNQTHIPPIPGLSDFKGKLVHTAQWDPTYDYKGKRVAVIGNGASGQQLLPNIAGDVKHLDHYVRSKVWISPTFRAGLHEATADAPGGPKFSPEQKQQWEEDPESYLKYRKLLESGFHGTLHGSVKGSPQNNLLRESIIKTMLKRLNGDEKWLARVIPDYAPGCKRITPAPGYLETLLEPHVEYVTEPIVSATANGLVTADGTVREVDAIFAATGFKGGYVPRFPTIGKGGIDLRDKWSFDSEPGYPETYLGVMAPGFPNYFFILQAQGNGQGGTVPLQAETSSTFIAKVIRKIQSQSYASLDPRLDATEDFNNIVSGYFDNKVTTDTCNSWFKPQRIAIAWPGSGHHRIDALKDPRWEDFEFQRAKGAEQNRYEYFGDGNTAKETRFIAAKNDPKANDVTPYLKEISKVDLEVLHEHWNQ
ncbi:FAD/NAD(P)-binding domain-containing protein [Hyaloscypha variabilis F]|uniref:FAD/NAD(P)-binding domain-containing protein n=1 Tax=Hyaloscypha variabilis (strain UAMH 11265 / GT02V1 / F) TaxID=1149755 RepID=A0A2J6QZP1_HYAVF|nr:FAD/NAD(P)-binding domain-containing protein [Hyaloscypha variabilis F]